MAGTQQLPVKYPIAFAAGDDFTLTLTVTESAAAYVWGTVVATIVGHATVTAFTVSLPADGTAILSLTDTQTTALGAGGYAWHLTATKAGYSQTWMGGTLTVTPPGTPGTSAVSATVTVTTGATATVTVTSTGGRGIPAGGTTGQSLTKASGTSYDVAWSTPASAGGGFAALKNALAGGASVALGVIGDSTANATDEWAYLLATRIAALYPAHTVNHWLWNASTQSFDTAPTVIQTGAAGERWTNITTSGSCSIADSAAVSITGDLELIVRVALDDWTPAAEQPVVSKFGAVGQRSWQLYVDGSRPTLRWSADGSTLITVACPSGQGWTTPADGSAIWLRVTLDVNNGASGNTLTFYTATTYGTWTQVGQVITAGVTSIFDSTTALQIGCRGGVGAEGGSMAGKVGHVEIRDGFAGPIVAPVLPEHWDTRTASGIAQTGAPVLSIINASHAGADVTYLGDATRVKKMSPDFGQAVTIVNCGHNDGALAGSPLLALYDTLLSGLRARLPLGVVAITTQNPRTSPATYIAEQRTRSWRQVAWAKRNNLTTIDALSAFIADGRALSLLTDPAGGVHPTTAGSVLWADVMTQAFNRTD